MKRFHVHLSVDDLAQSIGFYSRLFGQAPAVERTDYAKWMLDDPRVNFAISARGHALGVNHFGFQAEDTAELQVLKQRADAAAGDAVLDQGETACLGSAQSSVRQFLSHRASPAPRATMRPIC